MAGAEGLEPSTKVLETHVLPLHHAPTFFRTGIIIHEIRRAVNSKIKKYIISRKKAASAALKSPLFHLQAKGIVI